MKKRIFFFFCVLIFSSSLFAHKIKVFASRDGKKISGYVYFSGGGKGKNLKLDVLGGDGRKLANIFTDSEGRFIYEPKKEENFTFVVNSGDGHKATYTVKAVAGLTPRAKESSSTEGIVSEKTDSSQFREIIREEVSHQLMPLREQLEKYEEKVRFRDILGGIGFIFGIAGIYFYFLARKKN
jgi:nickel transport protein